MSKIKVNNEEQEVTLPLSLSELIKLNKVLQPDMVSVQLNGNFVLKEDFDSAAINEGDEVDFLYFMGGGR
ncbi:MAG: sulfur carrier protein ThiS [Candidatus Symbiothrix sp.]|jgi:sulfur carrier protein|nr:sulfur carrier protein ThiS [Candidatus Symbiothrix sp.]